MTTVFYLVRHAAHDNLGNFLAGRSEGIRLGRAG
ncbi:histidine phosphatase family protein, partial [Rhizobiaceae sp. 2RAB30]